MLKCKTLSALSSFIRSYIVVLYLYGVIPQTVLSGTTMASAMIGEISVAQLAAIVLVTCTVIVLVRQRYFSPISDVPGPFLASFGTGWQLWHVFKGRSEEAIYDLHLKYGKNSVSSHQCIMLTWRSTC